MLLLQLLEVCSKAVDHCAKVLCKVLPALPSKFPHSIWTDANAFFSIRSYAVSIAVYNAWGKFPRLIHASCRVLIAHSPTYGISGATINRPPRTTKLRWVEWPQGLVAAQYNSR